MRLKWTRIGSNGMQSGEYRVAKNQYDGCTLYVLYFKFELLKYCDSFDGCREVAEKHEREIAGK